MIYSREEILAARAEMPQSWKRTARWRMGSEIDTVETSEAVGLSNGGFDWSSQTALGSSTADFDRQALALARERVEARLGQRAERLQAIDTVSLMGKLGATVNGVPTHGALLLLGKASADAHLAGLAPRIQVSRYDEDGKLYQKMTVRMPFLLGIERLVDTLCDRGDYRPDAVRELVTNAVAHCDYLLRGNIEITDRRGVLTVVNRGTWAKGTPAGALRTDFDPAPMRNAALCRLMVQCGVMDALGVGLLAVQSQLRVRGLPALTFDRGEDTVTARLYASQKAEQTSQELPPLPHAHPVAAAERDGEGAGKAADSGDAADADTATGAAKADAVGSEAAAGADDIGSGDTGAAGSADTAPAVDATESVLVDSSEDKPTVSRGVTDDDPAAGGENAKESAAASEEEAGTVISGENLFFAQAWGVDSAAIAKQRAEAQAAAEEQEAEDQAAEVRAADGQAAVAEERAAAEAQAAGDAQAPANAIPAVPESDAQAQAAPESERQSNGSQVAAGASDAEAQSVEEQATVETPAASEQAPDGHTPPADQQQAPESTGFIVLRESEEVSSEELKAMIVPILAEGNGMTRSEIVKALRATGIQAENSKFARRVGRLLDQLHKAGVIQKGNPDKRHWYIV